MAELAKTIGRRLRYYRLLLGLSQEQVAEIAQCHPTYIGQVERGEKNATIESLDKIASAVSVPLSQLFYNTDEESKDDIPMKCYDLLITKSKAEQDHIFNIIMELDKYKDSPSL